MRLTVNYHWNFYAALTLIDGGGTAPRRAARAGARAAPAAGTEGDPHGGHHRRRAAVPVRPGRAAQHQQLREVPHRLLEAVEDRRGDHPRRAPRRDRRAPCAGRRLGVVPQPRQARHRRPGRSRQPRRGAGLPGSASSGSRSLVWTLAGGLAAVTTDAERAAGQRQRRLHRLLGPGMLLRTLAVAVIAGMASMPIALGRRRRASGSSKPSSSTTTPPIPAVIDGLLFVVVLIAVLVLSSRNRSLGRRERFSFAPRVRPIPESLRGNWLIRNHGRVGAYAALALAVIVPLVVTSQSRQFLYTQILAHGAHRAVADRAHRLGRAALARPVRARRYRRGHGLRVVREPGAVPARARSRCGCGGARGRDRRPPGAAHARPVPCRDDPRARRRGAMDARATDLRDQQ